MIVNSCPAVPTFRPEGGDVETYEGYGVGDPKRRSCTTLTGVAPGIGKSSPDPISFSY